MKYKVTNKQKVAKNCFICGRLNESGLRMAFYETENAEVVGVFTGKPNHVSYPDRLHGGIISAILDETIGRAIELLYPGMLGVTMELIVRYKKPVPMGVELRSIGRITSDTSRCFKGSGEIKNLNGEVLATAEGTYMKIDRSLTIQKNPQFLDDELLECEEIENLEYIEY